MPSQSLSTSEKEDLRQELEKLRCENERLRQENQAQEELVEQLEKLNDMAINKIHKLNLELERMNKKMALIRDLTE